MGKRRKSHCSPANTLPGLVSRAGFLAASRPALWWAALFLGVFPIAFRQVSVSDAWWHVALGKWLVEKRTLPDLTQFYFSPFDPGPLASELRWEWLGDIIFYFSYAAMGAAGMQWLVIGCLIAGLGFLAMLVHAPVFAPKGHAAPVRSLPHLSTQRRIHVPAIVAKLTGRTPNELCEESGVPHATRGPWLLLLLFAVCLGTYQLQLARNSVFSLALYPGVLWLGLRKSGPPSRREYATMGGTVVLWSCLHGSCVLGWATAFAILGARAASAFLKARKGDEQEGVEAGRTPDAGSWKTRGVFPWRGLACLHLRRGAKSLLIFSVASSISLALIVAGRNGAVDFLLLPIRHVGSSLTAKPPAASIGPASSQLSRPVKTAGIKEWLNSSIWKPDPGTPWSNDYWSPFDMLPGMRPIEAAFGLAAIAAACILWFRNIPLGLLVAWAGAVFLGLGYVRMFGYTALASGAVILSCTSGMGKAWFCIVRRCAWLAVGVWIAFSWQAFVTGQLESLIPEGQHVSQFGKVPIYDDAVCDWAMSEYPREKVFTTIESGSYCLLRWGFQKQVFLDGFFAPHTGAVWDAYHATLNSGDLSPLHEQFGITMAIIPTTSEPWARCFLRSPDWNPAAIGAGSVVFLHKSIPTQGRSPRIFFTAGDLRKTSAYFRYHALRNVFLVTTADKPGGFTPEQWASHPAFGGFRELAKEVFPLKP